MSTLRLGGLALVAVLLAGALSAGAVQAPPQGPVVEIIMYEFGLEPTGVELTPGVEATFRIVNAGDAPHNLFIGEDGAVGKHEPTLNNGESALIKFVVPETGRIVYYCAVPGHRELGMEAFLTVKGTPGTAGPGHAADAVVALGVNYFAYWVGVVSFIVLFVVIAATFFLLRYGETAHWTDWKDRPAKDKGEAAAKPAMGTWVVLGLVMVVFIVAAVQVARLV